MTRGVVESEQKGSQSGLKNACIWGYGAQAKAWGLNLRDSGVEVTYLLREKSPSRDIAESLGFRTEGYSGDVAPAPAVLQIPLQIILISDLAIRPTLKILSPCFDPPTLFVLGHGYAVYQDPKTPLVNAPHRIGLFAPKAIGPKLRDTYLHARPHDLKAGTYYTTEADQKLLGMLSEALGFQTQFCTFIEPRLEAIGDLISEQTLLCGTVFSALELTIQKMKEVGIPDAMIRAECLEELELIASVLKTRGLSGTLETISEAARIGAVKMRNLLATHSLPAAIDLATADVISGKYSKEFETEPKLKVDLEDWIARTKDLL